MNCPDCGAAAACWEHLATGDWYVRYDCGSSNDDNGDKFRSNECREREQTAKETQSER